MHKSLELSKVCPNEDSIDYYYRIGQCIDGYMYTTVYGSCNSTYYSYTYYYTTNCETPIYEMVDALNVCVESDIFRSIIFISICKSDWNKRCIKGIVLHR
ncbi:hypothetical protein ACTFIZ_001709 [Dictyostelium cf. discoideum]